MPYEIEIKAAIAETEKIRQLLTKSGCTWKTPKIQYDQIFYRADNYLQKRKELFFRIRDEDGKKYILSLKEILNSMEVREYESVIQNPHDVLGMIKELGFSEYCVLRKRRTEGSYGVFSVCLDEVDGLGCFIEIEKIVYLESERVQARKEVNGLLASLGIKEKDICNKRYHTMMAEK